MPEKQPPFVFERYAFDAATGALTLCYAFEGGPRFEETIVFAPPYRAMGASDVAALDGIFRLIFLLAGVSYYKARVPQNLRCDAFPLDVATARWLEGVYTQGLGEFAYRNGLDLRGRVHFADAGEGTIAPAPVRLDLPQKLLVPVGGGKDSVVSLEALRRGGADVTLFALGGPTGAAAPIADCLRVAALPHVYITRTLSPVLMDLNRAGAYNGHVPITAILSAIALAAAILYGYAAVVMSNERSASVGNLSIDGFEVNHQYSKSFTFERELAGYVARHVSPDLKYFSLLRPLGELAITKAFAHVGGAYFDVFRSCNTAFRQEASARGKHWCCDCPKCRFVFLALAPFMERARLIEVFGRNMLDDATQISGFAALGGIGADKPFECVGEIEESLAALSALAAAPEWNGDAVITALAPHLAEGADLAPFLEASGPHAVPQPYLEMLHDVL